MSDYTIENWRLLRHVYSGWVRLENQQLHNGGKRGQLHSKHFRALKRAAKNKPLGRRDRRDDNLLNAIGNWLYSIEDGAWRNPNRDLKYGKGNKQIWQDFIIEAPNESLRRARG